MLGAEGGRRTEMAVEPAQRTWLGREVLLVLGVSLGASALYALISFTGTLTAPGDLSSYRATLNGSRAPGRPWLDLARQLAGISTSLVPALLALFLLARSGDSARSVGFDLRRPKFDLALGAGLAAAIGGSGLALYLGARAGGANLTVIPTTLPPEWWRIPVLVLSALQNSLLEELVVVAYLLRRLDQLGWSPARSMAASALLRGTYHLYQGIGGFFGNAVMGVIFVLVYRRYGRVMPLVVAHGIIDIFAFVGYVLLAGKVDWLPT